jgi:hypothetical protein
MFANQVRFLVRDLKSGSEFATPCQRRPLGLPLLELFDSRKRVDAHYRVQKAFGRCDGVDFGSFVWRRTQGRPLRFQGSQELQRSNSPEREDALGQLHRRCRPTRSATVKNEGQELHSRDIILTTEAALITRYGLFGGADHADRSK